MLRNIYYFIDKFNRKEIEKLNKSISIIYRNYYKNTSENELDDLVKLCKMQSRKVYISNDLKIALKCNFDGVYIPSFNTQNRYKNLPKKRFEIIGSAHNVREIYIKQAQGCTKIFLAPLFKNKKNKYFLGTIRFNLLKLYSKTGIVCLGGINEKNLRKCRLCNTNAIASISWIKKNGPSINTGPF